MLGREIQKLLMQLAAQVPKALLKISLLLIKRERAVKNMVFQKRIIFSCLLAAKSAFV